jgi:hydrogenase nickel incorporation protein HypA/HybF
VSLDEDETEAIHFMPEIAHIYIRCPQCKSPDFDIIQGRGVQVGVIEGER